MRGRRRECTQHRLLSVIVITDRIVVIVDISSLLWPQFPLCAARIDGMRRSEPASAWASATGHSPLFLWRAVSEGETPGRGCEGADGEQGAGRIGRCSSLLSCARESPAPGGHVSRCPQRSRLWGGPGQLEGPPLPSIPPSGFLSSHPFSNVAAWPKAQILKIASVKLISHIWGRSDFSERARAWGPLLPSSPRRRRPVFANSFPNWEAPPCPGMRFRGAQA